MKENALVAQDIRVEHAGRVVLCDLNFEVAVFPEFGGEVPVSEEGAGVVVCVFGAFVEENRAFLRVLAGMQRPSGGSVRLRGQDVYANGENVKRKLGFVPVGNLVPESLRVQRAVDYAAELRLSELEPEVRRARVLEVLKVLGLDKFADVRVSKLEGKERFGVMVAVEMLSSPEVLLLEDPPLEAGVLELLRELCRVEKVSVVCVFSKGVGESWEKDLDGAYRLDGGKIWVESRV